MNDTKLIFNSLGFEKIENNIWVIHDFLSKEEQKEYTNLANSVNEEEWWKGNDSWYKGKFLEISNMPIMQTSLNISERFANLFQNKNKYTFGSPSSIHRMLPGQDMYVHADFPETDRVQEDHVLFTAAMYFNEFQGGELFYSEIGIEYKPKPGDLVIHPGTTQYRHGVKPVLGSQTRYMSNTWVADNVGLRIKTNGYLNK